MNPKLLLGGSPAINHHDIRSSLFLAYHVTTASIISQHEHASPKFPFPLLQQQRIVHISGSEKMTKQPPRSKIFRWAKFNLKALLLLAEKLRGRSSTCDESKAPKSGSLNWVIFLTFDDGVEWAFRSSRYDTCTFSDETASKILVSEASTLRYLATHCQIPVPKVYSYR
jgi:hypothetical protein